MNRVDSLRNARNSYAVKLKEYIHITAAEPDVLVCFFEGDDVKYFGPRLQLLRPDLKWESINCGGKKIVLKLWEIISGHAVYADKKTAFFLDRDFDPPHVCFTDSRVYVTPSYSVENLYVTPDVLRRVLRQEFQFSGSPEADINVSNAIDRFKSRLNEFVDAAAEINAWIVFQRRAEATHQETGRMNLGGLNMHHLFQVDVNNVRKLYTASDLVVLMPESLPVSQADLETIIESFEPSRRHFDFRGKFQAHFMRLFVNALVDDVVNAKPTCFSERRNCMLNVSDRNFLSDLSQYADTPTCLRAFLATLN